MAQRQQVGELDRRKVAPKRRSCGRQCGELIVGGRQDDNVGRLLAEVARDFAVIDRSALVELEMHLSLWLQPASAARAAAWSNPFRPMTTMPGFGAASGRVNEMSMRAPTACMTAE